VCDNHGDGHYTCYCYDGSSGYSCPGGMQNTACNSNPCNNMGSCSPMGDYDYMCYCYDGSSGHTCSGDHYNPCDSNPCNMQGSCMHHGDGHYTCYCYDGSQGQTCGGPTPTPTPGPDRPDQFNCEQYYHGTSQCEMRKAWLCDYAQWRWTTLTVWLNQFHEYVHNTGHQLEMTMPTCNDEKEQAACRNPEMHRCRYNEHMHCNECYCADHEYSNLEGLMDHWRHDYRAWATFFQEYRRVMQNNGGFGHNHGNNDTC
jgi:hypothetical protein